MGKIMTTLKEHREQKKLTQRELAELVGVRRETIVHLENNRYNPSLELALEIARIFELPIEALFRLNDKDE